MLEKRLLKFWSGIALLAILNLVLFDMIIYKSPETLQVQYVPDDAYYYLSLARNFANLHSWTFDSGISLTSGFHPLLAYVLTLLYKIFQPSEEGFLRIDLAISNIFAISPALILFWKGIKKQQPFILASLAILLSTRNILINSISGVEWSLLVFIIVLFCVTFLEGYSTPAGRVALFILGLTGSLARADFGLLTLSFTAASFIIWFTRKNGEFLKASITGLTGAATGVALVFLHNYLLTGLAVQSSALMKSYWMLGKINWGILFLTGLGLLALLLIPIFSGNLAKKIKISDQQLFFSLGALFTWIGYGVFYSKNSDVQPWYSANFLFPIFMFLIVLWNSIQHGWLKKYTFVPHLFFGIGFAVIFLQTCINSYPINEQNSQWPHQLIFLQAGEYLRDHPLDHARVGAWNAGIINYYQGGDVINLDGLVNNEIYAYAIQDSSFEYIQKVNIEYVIDFDLMFTKAILKRSGYDDPRFKKSLVPVLTFDNGQYPVWKHLTLYQIRKSQ